MKKYQRNFKPNAAQIQQQASEAGVKLSRKRNIPVFMKENNITYKQISEWFGYSSANSFYNSYAKQDIIDGVEELIKYLKKNEGL